MDCLECGCGGLLQRANARHSGPKSGEGADLTFKRRNPGQILRTSLDREQRSGSMTTLEAANGKCRLSRCGDCLTLIETNHGCVAETRDAFTEKGIGRTCVCCGHNRAGCPLGDCLLLCADSEADWRSSSCERPEYGDTGLPWRVRGHSRVRVCISACTSVSSLSSPQARSLRSMRAPSERNCI